MDFILLTLYISCCLLLCVGTLKLLLIICDDILVCLSEVYICCCICYEEIRQKRQRNTVVHPVIVIRVPHATVVRTSDRFVQPARIVNTIEIL